MKRPLPLTFRVWLPPVPVAVEKIEVQVLLSLEVWIWKAFPNAVSQLSTTWHTLLVEPRSTSSHCGSENWLDQRVPWFPSVAFGAGKLLFSCDDDVVGWWSAMFVVPQVAAEAVGAVRPVTSPARARAAPATAAVAARRDGPAHLPCTEERRSWIRISLILRKPALRGDLVVQGLIQGLIDSGA